MSCLLRPCNRPRYLCVEGLARLLRLGISQSYIWRLRETFGGRHVASVTPCAWIYYRKEGRVEDERTVDHRAIIG